MDSSEDDESSSSIPRGTHEVGGAGYDSDVIYHTDSDKEDNPDDAAPQWTQPKTTLERDITTELLVAHSIEHRTSKSGRERIVMICPSVPPSSTPKHREMPLPNLRWLHIQQSFPDDNNPIYAIRLIERMLLKCPFISAKARSTAAVFCKGVISDLLRDAEENTLDAFSISSTDFVSGVRPYPTLRLRRFLFLRPAFDQLPYTKSLLTVARGYDVPVDDELNQVARKMLTGPGDHVLKLGMLWIFTFGPGILITLSCLPMNEIRGNLVCVDDKTGRGFYTVDNFLQRVVTDMASDIGPPDITEYELLYQRNDSNPTDPLVLLSPTTWLDLTASGSVESVTFYLRQKEQFRRLERRSYSRLSSRGLRTAPSFSRERQRTRTMDEAREAYTPSTRDGPGGHDPTTVVVMRERARRRSGTVGQAAGESSSLPPAKLNPSANGPLDGPDDDKLEDDGKGDDRAWDGTVDDNKVADKNANSDEASDNEASDSKESDDRTDGDKADGDKPDSYRAGGDRKGKDREGNEIREHGETEESDNSSSIIEVERFHLQERQQPVTVSDEDVMVRMLKKIDESLSSNENQTKKIYCRAFECTRDELLGRHPFLLPEEPRTEQAAPTPSASSSNPGGECIVGKQKGSDSRETETSPQPGLTTAEPPQDPRGEQQANGQSTQNNNQLEREHSVTSVSRQLFERSQSIFWQFLPNDHETLGHPVCKRYWGAVDEIIRQLCWSRTRARTSWIVRKSAEFLAEQQDDKCLSCLEGHKYSSASEALKHLHAAHVKCPVDEKRAALTKTNPPDDPCFAYLENPPGVDAYDSALNDTLSEAMDHLEDLEKLDETLRRLHRLVAKTNRTRAFVPRFVGLGQTPVAESPRPPQLPRHLVYAFEELVSYLVVAPRSLSVMNRVVAKHGSRGDWPEGAFMRFCWVDSLRTLARENLDKHLQQAECDICMFPAGLDEDDDPNAVLGIKSFDFSSLARVIGTSILSNFIVKPFMWKIAFTVVTDTNYVVDVVGMYKEYCRRLRSEADRRPRRRLILKIAALLDELDVLRATFEYALERVDILLSELDDAVSGGSPYGGQYPASALCEVEHDCLLHERARLNVKVKEINALVHFSEEMQHRVRQMIEVMDEDHGKAIRVFTVVTVLFVPMTFVSGFFGMNTIDIRDIDANQTLYWIIAIPVTLMTLFAAFAYGYKGDEIGDWIHKKYRNFRPSRAEMKRTAIMERQRVESMSLTEGEPVVPVERHPTREFMAKVKAAARDRFRRRKRREFKPGSTFYSDVY
ncbi:hypothetical protein VTJ49DRAFT_352 [Mycothermus thermophilus]|uniref:Uncharacterized protein n=1 Tax=Humicola insolens TaxID=85995 RepID=A0ABR3VFL0_HUMIN